MVYQEKSMLPHINLVTYYTYIFHEYRNRLHLSWTHFTLHFYRLPLNYNIFGQLSIHQLQYLLLRISILESLPPSLCFSSKHFFLFFLFNVFLYNWSSYFCLFPSHSRESSCTWLVLPNHQHPLPKVPNFLCQTSTPVLCQVFDSQTQSCQISHYSQP